MNDSADFLRDIKSVLVLGAGAIVIGQGCEFDYSGTQACKQLRRLGLRVILVNPNPATVMTDVDVADRTYMEPLTLSVVEDIISRERPDAILPTSGGQTALNLAVELDNAGVLERYGVRLIGVDSNTIRNAEDRQKFKDVISSIGLKCIPSVVVTDVAGAEDALHYVGLPAVLRPSFTLGGLGGGVAYNMVEYRRMIADAFALSPQIQVDRSLVGWKEYELEVAIDMHGNAIVVCNIENVDPVGVHTGDSLTVSPIMTLTDKEYQKMRDSAIAIVRAVGVKGGCANVQFAVNPKDGEQLAIEMNPRVSRSSALASKATGFPIATVSASLAMGNTLDKIQNECTFCVPASFEPSIDYVVVKMPRFDFNKFDAPSVLSTSMRATGEVMAIGANFKQAMQKALCSLEEGHTGLDGAGALSRETAQSRLTTFEANMVLRIADALRAGISLDEVCGATFYDQWFVEQIGEVVSLESHILPGMSMTKRIMLDIKKAGISDARLAKLLGISPSEATSMRRALDVRPVYRRVDTCAGEFKARVSYMYSCYVGDAVSNPQCESCPSTREKVVILGNGCTRIGQGIEFDYACVHASLTAKSMGLETIMINSNPSTVSTDYGVSDRLYLEPITLEHVIEVLDKESQDGKILGVIVQMGGQTPLKLARDISSAGYRILGTSIEAIDLAEDREKFSSLLDKLNLQSPPSGVASCAEDLDLVACGLGFPVLLRPSYVLGGESMAVISDAMELGDYLVRNRNVFSSGPLLVDKFLVNSAELDVEAICDGEQVYVVGVMEHIEAAGVHSGDSSCSMPPRSISEHTMQEIKRQTKLLALSLGIVGLMNVQYAIKDNIPYILEVNPRASRTVPFVTKATGIPLVDLATRMMCGEKIDFVALENRPDASQYVSVKIPVFPFNKFNNAETILGPQMRSTGETMGIDRSFGAAFAKAYVATGSKLPTSGCAFLSIANCDKNDSALYIARCLCDMGFSICATSGTAAFLCKSGIEANVIKKVREGRPHILDAIVDNKISLIINTTEGSSPIRDSRSIRRSAISMLIPCVTTICGALAMVEAIREVLLCDKFEVFALQDISHL